MIVRAVILAVAAAAIGLLASNLRDAKACEGARQDLFEVVIGHLPAVREPGALRDIQSRCRGTDGIVAASAALDRQRRLPEALRLATLATRREPDSATAWNALAVAAAANGRRAQALRAFARAKRLSPLGQAPVTLPDPARDRAAPDGGP